MSIPPLQLSLEIGKQVAHGSSIFIITNLIDIENVLARDLESGKIHRLRISELTPVNSNKSLSNEVTAPSATIPDEDWNEAMVRFKIILPLLKNNSRKRIDVQQYAVQHGYSVQTLYRWINTYNSTGVVSSLVRKGRSDKGKGRLSSEIESLIQDSIRKVFLHKQCYSIPSLIEQIKMQCHKAEITPPHENTIRNRISAIAEEEIIRLRRGHKEAEQKFSPLRGSFPGADYPMAVMQIDHTPMDVIVVDDINRLPIGRAWITLAIDVFSRMVCGFYISLEPPSTMSVALCIAHAVLPKEKWLANREISISWPIWGIPDTIHVDNAREFRGNTLKRACQEYGITLTWRPVATPNYGGHIERYLGDLMKHIHELPGTTFSNPSDRGEYDSERKAIMTMTELEKWITIHILGRYHQRKHSEIGMPPIKKLELGILGGSDTPGSGMPPRIQDEPRVLLDFMPLLERTIQDYGVMFENICYYSNVLRRWINAKDPDNPKLKRKFTFRYDPRDISNIYFLDPELNAYYSIPYRTTSRPVINIWELREATRKAKETYGNEINENLIFSSYEDLRAIEHEAAKNTKAVRRAAQQKINTQSRTDYLPIIKQNPMHVDSSQEICDSTEVITPFDDIDEDIKP